LQRDREEPGPPYAEASTTGIPWGPIAATVIAVLLVGSAVLWLHEPLATLYHDREALHGFLDRQGAWAPLAFMGLQAAQVVLAPIPGHLLAVAAGLLFGPWLGTLYTVLGVGSGSALVIIATRRFGRPLVSRLVPAAQRSRVDRWAMRHGMISFFLFFFIPFLPDDLACFAIGLSPLPVLPMLGVVVLARLPGHFVSAWIGALQLPPAAWIGIIGLAGILTLLYWRHRLRIEQWLLQRIERRTGAGAHERDTRKRGVV
jgi:uncharacterized membrane protein YdjX (TVP38/TMEM64 family)